MELILDPRNYLIDVPKLHPLGREYPIFWKEQKKRVIEGHWSGGYFCPPGLYFYGNFGTILLNKGRSNNKTLDRPLIQDLEWYLMREWMLARGFSGFSDDQDQSGDYLLLDRDHLSDQELLELYPHLATPDNTPKEFRNPRSILSDYHSFPKGKPLYTNEARNLLILGSRDTGKSYIAGIAIVLHQWLINGQLFYTDPAQNPDFKVNPVDITVGAELAHYSTSLLDKARTAYENLPGKVFLDRYYPSPLSQAYSGTWNAGGNLVAQYKKRYKGGWEFAGSKSKIRHRTFKDNPFADQGTRPLAIVLDEVGVFSNLEQVYLNTKDNLRRDLRKTGSLVMMGTGGSMESGTIDAHKMFYSPESYDILTSEDRWENRGLIGTFIPAYMALREYKNELGYTKEELALTAIQKERDRIRKGNGGSEALNKELQYRPIKPSEMFLVKGANIFPVAEVANRIGTVLDKEIHTRLGKKVILFKDETSPFNKIAYDIDLSKDAIQDWPIKSDANSEGTLIVYEFPYIDKDTGTVPQGAYLIGYDPIKDNVATSQTNTQSLACFHVIKTYKYPNTVGYSEIVATYIGRPYQGSNVVNELLYKTSMFYGNATIFFENAVGNTKDYFEKVKRLDLLAKQPTTVLNRKASFNTPEQVIYGYPMSNDKIKWEALQYVRSWLLEERDDAKTNLDLIPDLVLLKQLLTFDLKGNFDSVMALVGCILGLEETHNKNKTINLNTATANNNFYDPIINNPKLFRLKHNEEFSKTTSFF